MNLPTRFQQLVSEAKKHIRQIGAEELPAALAERHALLIDVREEEDFRVEHARQAIHLSRGMIETEIEEIADNPNTPIICYCGGGSRSALVVENLQRMGYTDVRSLTGGFRAYKSAGLPVES